MAKQKILYIDMDDTLVDFKAGLREISPEVAAEYAGREDEIPDFFETLQPLEGAIDAFHELAEIFDTYILSTAPWHNASAWRHKLEWVQKHLCPTEDSKAIKRLILSHHKHLNRGDFLVDDLMGGKKKVDFEGELIRFGTTEFPDWPTVVAYLKTKA